MRRPTQAAQRRRRRRSPDAPTPHPSPGATPRAACLKQRLPYAAAPPLHDGPAPWVAVRPLTWALDGEGSWGKERRRAPCPPAPTAPCDGSNTSQPAPADVQATSKFRCPVYAHTHSTRGCTGAATMQTRDGRAMTGRTFAGSSQHAQTIHRPTPPPSVPLCQANTKGAPGIPQECR